MKNKASKMIGGLAVVLSLLSMTLVVSFAEVPNQISYQGILNDADGKPVANGNYTMVFSLYDDDNSTGTGDQAFWSKTMPVPVATGIFDVVLEDINPVDLDRPGDIYLGLAVESDPEMTPRQRLTSTPFAIRAKEAEHAQTANNASQADTLNPTLCSTGEVLVKYVAGWECQPLPTPEPICDPTNLIPCFEDDLSLVNVGICRAGYRGCLPDGSGYGSCNGSVYPHPEVCDMVDNDCNGFYDDNAVDAPIWYQDSDSDGFGTSAVTAKLCPPPFGGGIAGYSDNTRDCDDSNVNTYPGATEWCDGINNDCDGQTDESCQPRPYCLPSEQTAVLICAYQFPENASSAIACMQSGGDVGTLCQNLGTPFANCLEAAGCSGSQSQIISCIATNCSTEFLGLQNKVNAADGVSCDDGDACTLNDIYTGGFCNGTPMDCGNNECVDNYCSNGICQSEYLPLGEECDDGNSATSSDVCDGNGVCSGV